MTPCLRLIYCTCQKSWKHFHLIDFPFLHCFIWMFLMSLKKWHYPGFYKKVKHSDEIWWNSPQLNHVFLSCKSSRDPFKLILSLFYKPELQRYESTVRILHYISNYCANQIVVLVTFLSRNVSKCLVSNSQMWNLSFLQKRLPTTLTDYL